MAETTVYGCDWCKEIVQKQPSGTAGFAAKIRHELIWPGPALGDRPKVYEICDGCNKAFRALTQGKFKR